MSAADQIVSSIYRYGDQRFAQALGSAICVSVPYSLSGEDSRVKALLPEKTGMGYKLPWARPPFKQMILLSAGENTAVVVTELDKSGVPSERPLTWLCECVHLALCPTPGGARVIAAFAALVAGLQDGHVSKVLLDSVKSHHDESRRKIIRLGALTSGLGEEAMSGWFDQLDRAAPTFDYGGQLLSVVACAFALMNCRNVTTRDVAPSRQARRSAERSGEPKPYTVKTLIVRPSGASSTAGSGSGQGQPLALHWVRGHFKHFTPERPLFGKLTGTYWWHPTLAGSRSAGVVVKDYALAEPQDH